MKKAVFYTPVVTAFDRDRELDIRGNINVYEHLIRGGMDGIVVMGSTGEFFAMTDRQKKDLIDLAGRTAKGRTRVMIGVSCLRVDETVELGNYAIAAGADAVMAISPYYFALTDESVEYFYDRVADGIRGDIYLYNFPDRTVHDLSPEVTLRLLRKHPNIIGQKDTVAGMEHTKRLIRAVGGEFPEFEILSGYEENTVHNVLSGGSGCIGGLSNLYPELFSGLVEAVNAGDMERSSLLQKKADALSGLYEIGKPFVPVLKKAMILHGIEMEEYCTEPLLPADEAQTEKLLALMRKVESM